MIKDFTDEHRQVLKDKLIGADNMFAAEQDLRVAFARAYSDVLPRLPELIGNTNKAFGRVRDIQGCAIRNIDYVFDKIQEDDRVYAVHLKKEVTGVEIFINELQALADAISPGDGCGSGGVFRLSETDFQAGLPNTGKELVAYRLALKRDNVVSELVSVNEKGVKSYNWQKIQELLHKEGLQPHEKAALLMVVQGMTVVNADGTVSTDYKSLEKFMECGYAVTYTLIEDDAHCISEMNKGRASAEYTVTPNMAEICARYKQWVEGNLVLPNVRVLFADGPQGDPKTQKDYLMQEMHKSAVMDEIATRGSYSKTVDISYEDEDARFNEWTPNGDSRVVIYDWEPDVSITQVRGTSEEQKSYTIDLGATRRLEVFSFEEDKEAYLKKIIINAADGLYRKADQEFQGDLAQELVFTAIFEGLSKATDTYPALKGVSLAVQTARFTENSSIKRNQIEANNLGLDKIKDATELNFILHVFAIRCVITNEKGNIRTSFEYFDESELQIRVHSYNYARRQVDPNHQDVTVEELKTQLMEELDGGERTQDVQRFMNWWGYGEERNLYRSKLMRLHEELKKIQPEAIGKQIEELTPNQINILAEELNKKLQAEKEGKTYQLNPELDLGVPS